MKRLRLRAIACEVLARPIYYCAARSPNVVDVAFLHRRLHETPLRLRDRLQAEIDAAGEADPGYDAVVLAYGLCGGASAGVTASRIPLVVPRAHDCITLLLGSRARYEAEFAAHPGTYWYAPDFLERSDADPRGSTIGLFGIGSNPDVEPGVAYADYAARFGDDNAAYLMEMMGSWRDHYDRAAFLDTGMGDAAAEGKVRRAAEERGWLFERLTGDLKLFRRLLAGAWGDDFLVLEPGQRLAMSYDSSIARAEQVP